MRGETGPDGQNIFGHTDVLKNDIFLYTPILVRFKTINKDNSYFLETLDYHLNRKSMFSHKLENKLIIMGVNFIMNPVFHNRYEFACKIHADKDMKTVIENIFHSIMC